MTGDLVRVSRPSSPQGDDEVRAGQMPSDYLLLRREALALEMRWIEDELMRRREIRRRLCATARVR